MIRLRRPALLYLVLFLVVSWAIWSVVESSRLAAAMGGLERHVAGRPNSGARPELTGNTDFAEPLYAAAAKLAGSVASPRLPADWRASATYGDEEIRAFLMPRRRAIGLIREASALSVAKGVVIGRDVDVADLVTLNETVISEARSLLRQKRVAEALDTVRLGLVSLRVYGSESLLFPIHAKFELELSTAIVDIVSGGCVGAPDLASLSAALSDLPDPNWVELSLLDDSRAVLRTARREVAGVIQLNPWVLRRWRLIVQRQNDLFEEARRGLPTAKRQLPEGFSVFPLSPARPPEYILAIARRRMDVMQTRATTLAMLAVERYLVSRGSYPQSLGDALQANVPGAPRIRDAKVAYERVGLGYRLSWPTPVRGFLVEKAREGAGSTSLSVSAESSPCLRSNGAASQLGRKANVGHNR